MRIKPPAVVVFRDQRGIDRRLVIRLDNTSAIPRFEQLRAQLSVMVGVGRLEPGIRLPTIRELAEQLRMAPGTVARAYRELENESVVEGRGRAGTFVVDEPPHSEMVHLRRRRIVEAARRFVFELDQLGAGDDEALAALELALFEGKQGGYKIPEP